MADYRNYQARVATAGTRADASIDQGLRAYMIRVYNLMALGLAVTGIAALGTAVMATTGEPTPYMLRPGTYLTDLGYALYASPLRWVLMFSPLIFVFFFSGAIQRMSLSAAQITFWIFSAVMGISISFIFLVYTPGSIVQTFFITAAAFGALSLWGYTTTRDLSGWGSFLFMGVIGLILTMILNLFIGSEPMQFAISVIGVLIFAALTAYYTQGIKEMYYEGDGTLVAGRKAILGALSLYISFINMFMFLLHLLGNRE